jgi:lipoprotein-anchoring transpeptidase ErfK/SrfK
MNTRTGEAEIRRGRASGRGWPTGVRGVALAFGAGALAAAEDGLPRVEFLPPPPAAVAPAPSEPVAAGLGSTLVAQIALAGRGFSCGPIDGVAGAQTRAALAAFQLRQGLPATGAVDAATLAALATGEPLVGERTVTEADLAGLQPVSPTWLGKSRQTELAHETLLERLAEEAHAHPAVLQRLNPGIDWGAVTPGERLRMPLIGAVKPRGEAEHLLIRLGMRTLQVVDGEGRPVAHFPVSIARDVAKRPVGELRVKVMIPNPDYTFDPAVFPESEEGRQLGRRLRLPPGPNNPVGVVWIGLDRPGYGIHGTPRPEQVGRTESHGCFRLANWDAATLLSIAWVGMTVKVEP